MLITRISLFFYMSNQNFKVFSCLIFKTRLKVKSRFRFDFDLTVTHLLRCNRNLNEVNAMCKRARNMRKTSFLLHGIKHRLHLKSMLKYLLQASLLTQMFIILWYLNYIHFNSNIECYHESESIFWSECATDNITCKLGHL